MAMCPDLFCSGIANVPHTLCLPELSPQGWGLEFYKSSVAMRARYYNTRGHHHTCISPHIIILPALYPSQEQGRSSKVSVPFSKVLWFCIFKREILIHPLNKVFRILVKVESGFMGINDVCPFKNLCKYFKDIFFCISLSCNNINEFYPGSALGYRLEIIYRTSQITVSVLGDLLNDTKLAGYTFCLCYLF